RRPPLGRGRRAVAGSGRGVTGAPVPRFETERLLLREFIARDRQPFAALNADARVMEHFPRVLTREESDALVDRIGQHWAEDAVGQWAVERSDDGSFLGFVGLAAPSFESDFTPCVEVGW